MGSLLGSPKMPKPVKLPKVEPAPPAPVVEPPAPMPVPDDASIKTQKKKSAARRIAASGRASTLLSTDQTLGGA